MRFVGFYLLDVRIAVNYSRGVLILMDVQKEVRISFDRKGASV